MKLSIKFTAFFLAVVGALAVTKSYTIEMVRAQETQEVSIKFAGLVGDSPFNCSENYSKLGKPATTATVSDFRFYVSDIALIDSQGKAVPLSLTQDNKWQYQNVALLDFENKSGACANGTTEMRDQVVGTVPKGNYKGVQFTLGVPFNLNHEDATLAPSPLNLTSLWWSWRGGYKFLRVDFNNRKQTSGAATTKQEHSHREGFAIHLGSIGCQVQGNNPKPSSCSSPNTAKVVLSNFDPNKNVVVADLAALVANTNLEVNSANTAIGCMSSPNDKDCSGIMTSLGIPFDGKRPTGQSFFKVK